MKNKFLAALIFISGCISAFSQDWEWKIPTHRANILKDSHNSLYILGGSSEEVYSIEKRFSNGSLIWSKKINGGLNIVSSKIDRLNNLVLAGNFSGNIEIEGQIFSGKTLHRSSSIIIKISPDGKFLSANVYGSTRDVFLRDLFITKNEDYIIGGGYTGNFEFNGTKFPGDTLFNFFVLKMDRHHAVLWEEHSTNKMGEAWIDEAVEGESGNLVVTLTFQGFLEYKNADFTSSGQHLVQFDEQRNIKWSSMLGYPGITFNQTTDIQLSGNIIFMKESFNHHSYSTSILMWNEKGERSKRKFGSVADIAYEVKDEIIHYAFIGSNPPNTSPEYHYRKIGSMTLAFEDIQYDSISTAWSFYNEMQVIDSERFYITGYEGEMSSNFIGKFNMEKPLAVSYQHREAFLLFPNPNQGIFTLKTDQQKITAVKIFDVHGKCIFEQKEILPGLMTVQLNENSKGIYFIEVNTENGRLTRKIVIE